VPTLYILIASVSAVAVGAIGLVFTRRRKAQSFDQVSQSVLNRLRTEYR